jgi:hypothetical protein
MKREHESRVVRRRAIFASLRIVQATSVVFAVGFLLMIMFSGSGAGVFGPHDQRTLETVAPLIAQSQRALALSASGLTFLTLLLQLLALPLKVRWSAELRGWIR